MEELFIAGRTPVFENEEIIITRIGNTYFGIVKEQPTKFVPIGNRPEDIEAWKLDTWLLKHFGGDSRTVICELQITYKLSSGEKLELLESPYGSIYGAYDRESNQIVINRNLDRTYERE